MFPHNDGISDELSPRTIISGLTLDYNKHCRLEFGEYVQTHEEHDNSMASRSTGAIALRRTGNEQGGHYFLNLTSGKVLNRSHWTPLPMPQNVIDRVHVLAIRSHANRALMFRHGDGRIVGEDDEDYEESQHGNSDTEVPDSDSSVDSFDDDVDDDDNDDDNDHVPDDPMDLLVAGVAAEPSET